MTWPTKHFTSDDLDAFHSEALSAEVRLHLETCEACRRLVATDRLVLDQLSQLASYEPKLGFADRVMTRVAVGAPGKVPVLSFPKLTRRQIAGLVGLAAAMVLSVAWSAFNRGTLDSWLDQLTAMVWTTGTAALSALTSELTEHPWFDTVRQLLGSPAKLALVATLMLVAYGSGLLALRRLVTPSAGTVSDVNG